MQRVRGRRQDRALRCACDGVSPLAPRSCSPRPAWPAGDASAHGLVQRANLPIPEWLFAWARRAVLVVSFVALAVLWPSRGWRTTALAAAARARARARQPRRSRSCAARSASRCSVLVIVAGFVGAQRRSDNFAPTFVSDHVLGRAGVRQRAVRRRVPRVQPVARDRPRHRLGARAAGRRRAARTRSGSAAGRRRSGCWSSPGSSSWRAGASTRRRSSRAVLGYTVAHARGAGGLRRRDLDAPRRGVRRLLQPVLAPVDLRDARPAWSACGRRSAGCRGSDPVPGTVAFVMRDDRHGHVRRAQPGAAVAGLSPHLVDAVVTALGVAPTAAPKVADTVGLLLGVVLVGGFYRLGIEGARSVGGGIERRAPAARLHPHAGADRGGLRRRALPHVPGLRGPGDQLPGVGPVRPGLGPVRHRVVGDRLLAAQPERRPGTSQVAFVVVGHVRALVLAHDRALALYGERPRWPCARSTGCSA